MNSSYLSKNIIIIFLFIVIFIFFSFTNNLKVLEKNQTQTIKDLSNSKLKLFQPIIQRFNKPKVLLSIGENTNYTVQKNDTLYSIAKKFNVKLDSLLKANNLSEKDILKVGMVLSIPSSSLLVYSPVDDFEVKLKTEKILLLFTKSSIIFSPLSEGEVIYVGDISNFGRSIIIQHKDYNVVVSNISEIFVQINQKLNIQTCIGFSPIDNVLNICVFYKDKMLSLKNFLSK